MHQCPGHLHGQISLIASNVTIGKDFCAVVVIATAFIVHSFLGNVIQDVTHDGNLIQWRIELVVVVKVPVTMAMFIIFESRKRRHSLAVVVVVVVIAVVIVGIVSLPNVN
jgi:hypothetical protein